MNKIRRPLNDSADNPRYVETVPGRGYRFIGSLREEKTVQAVAIPAPEPVRLAAKATAPSQNNPVQTRRRALAYGALVVATAAIGFAAFAEWRYLTHSAATPNARVQQLTTNSVEYPIESAVLSPDGKYLGYGDESGIRIQVIDTGESHLLPRPRSLAPGDVWFPGAWSSDGTKIFATSVTSEASTAWSVSVFGGNAAVLRENALVRSVSPDGSTIAFLTRSLSNQTENAVNRHLLRDAEIWIMGCDGERQKNTCHQSSYLHRFGQVVTAWATNCVSEISIDRRFGSQLHNQHD